LKQVVVMCCSKCIYHLWCGWILWSGILWF
jgi:hypothetical protein